MGDTVSGVQPVKTAAIAADSRGLAEWILDIATVAIISLAAVGTAWCGYESKRWSALQTVNYSRANVARIEASVAASRSDALRMIDVGLFVQYQAALYSDRRAFAAFLRRRFRPEFAVALAAWLATKPMTNTRAPLSPFAMPAYRLKSDDEARAGNKRAGELAGKAVEDNEQSDRYVFATVLFALTSFLVGLSVKARYPVGPILFGIGASMLVATLVMVAAYPIR